MATSKSSTPEPTTNQAEALTGRDHLDDSAVVKGSTDPADGINPNVATPEQDGSFVDGSQWLRRDANLPKAEDPRAGESDEPGPTGTTKNVPPADDPPKEIKSS